MLIGNVGDLFKLSAGITAVLAIAVSQTLPRYPDAGEAALVGGCSAGLCNSERVALCGSVGDGCGPYEVCTSSTGDFLCTPADYCTAAGCHVVHGGSCH